MIKSTYNIFFITKNSFILIRVEFNVVTEVFTNQPCTAYNNYYTAVMNCVVGLLKLAAFK